MRRIYVAAPLFDEMELQRNLEIAAMLEEMGHQVYLPQRDSGEAAKGASRPELFRLDVEGLRESNMVLALLDGRVPDDGMCFEMGMATAWGKTIIGYRTDVRNFMDGHMNVMLEQCLFRCYNNREDLYNYFRRLQGQWQLL